MSQLIASPFTPSSKVEMKDSDNFSFFSVPLIKLVTNPVVFYLRDKFSIHYHFLNSDPHLSHLEDYEKFSLVFQLLTIPHFGLRCGRRGDKFIPA